MDHAINGLKEYIRATADMVREYPDDEELKRQLYGMISAINVMEIYYYGQHKTKYYDYVTK